MTEDICSAENATELGETAIRDLKGMAIPPLPSFYEVWFSHLGNTNKGLSSEILHELERRKSINEEFLASVHGRYFSVNTDPYKDIERFTSQLLNETDSLKDLSHQFGASSQELRKDLEIAEQEAKSTQNPQSSAKMLFTSLVETAQKAIKRNADLEHSLANASEKIDTLQSAIEAVAIDANTDFLTKLRNRRYFETAIERFGLEADNNATPMSLILADIDHFKSFNDNWGHQIGDQVLSLVASVLRDNVKGQDLLARYGGEEFAIALPNTSIQDAAKLADKIRIAVNKRRLLNKFTNTDLGRITMSFGVSAYSENDGVESMIRNADNALYKAKEAGRNQVVIEQN